MIYMKAIYKLLALVELTDLSKLIAKKAQNSFSEFLCRAMSSK